MATSKIWARWSTNVERPSIWCALVFLRNFATSSFRNLNIHFFSEMAENVVASDEPKNHSKGGQHLIRCLVPNKVIVWTKTDFSRILLLTLASSWCCWFQIVGGLIGKGGDHISSIRTACPTVSLPTCFPPMKPFTTQLTLNIPPPKATIKVKETPECPNAEER